MAERIEWGYLGTGGSKLEFFFKKSCRSVRNIMSVCEKNHVGLWEKIFLSENFTRKYPHMHRKKIPDYLHLFAEVPRLTTSIWRKIHQNLKQCRRAMYIQYSMVKWKARDQYSVRYRFQNPQFTVKRLENLYSDTLFWQRIRYY